MNGSCQPPQNTFNQWIMQTVQSFLCLFTSTISSSGGFLCAPDTGLPIFVRYKFSFVNGQQTLIVTDAWNLDGSAYTGTKTELVSCSGGGGGSTCCCKTWTRDLCYTIPAPEGTLYIYREDNAFVDHDGTYNLWTWNPDEAANNPLFVDATALVTGPNPTTNAGNGTFNSSYTVLYTYYSDSSNALRTTSLANPAVPVQVGSDVALTSSSSGIAVSSIYVDPTTDILWGVGELGPNIHFITIDPVTGDCTLQGYIGGATFYILGFDNLGNGYAFHNNICYTADVNAGTLVSSWSLSDSSEHIISFLGYAGNGHYGIYTYDGVTKRNRIVDLSDGTIIDTLDGQERGLFYSPSDLPQTTVEFTRLYSVDCTDILTTQDRDFITGEIIVIPEEAVIGACP